MIRAREGRPQSHDIGLKFKGRFDDVDARTTGGAASAKQKLCRLRFGGSAQIWGFAIYRANHDDYCDSMLPSGLLVGSAEEAPDTTCGLYFNDTTA